MVVIPFVIFIAVFVPFLKEGTVYWSLKIGYWELDITYEGIMTFLNIIVKSSLSIFLLVVASSTTPFADFLKGLDLLRIPRLMIMLMSFLYRYLFVLLDEARRLMRARSLRYFGSRYREQFRVIGYMIGVLFIRTFERAERIYSAMVVRGFHGEIPATKHFKLSYRDFFFIIGIIIFLISIVSGLVYKLEFLKKVYDIRLWQRL
jgi:cobalt/nickel transport system permease protein